MYRHGRHLAPSQKRGKQKGRKKRLRSQQKAAAEEASDPTDVEETAEVEAPVVVGTKRQLSETSEASNEAPAAKKRARLCEGATEALPAEPVRDPRPAARRVGSVSGPIVAQMTAKSQDVAPAAIETGPAPNSSNDSKVLKTAEESTTPATRSAIVDMARGTSSTGILNHVIARPDAVVQPLRRKTRN